MSNKPPALVRLSFALMIATMVIATWQAIDRFQRTPVSLDNPGAVQNAGLLMGLTLFAIWLLVALPSIGALYGLRFCRTILAVFSLLGLLAFFYQPRGGWDRLTLVLTAVQLAAVAILYVGASRPFFAPTDDR